MSWYSIRMPEWHDFPKINIRVSNDGQVRSIRPGRSRKTQLDRKGYPVITVYYSKRRAPNHEGRRLKHLKVHRLVLKAFGPPQPSPEHRFCNHINGVKHDNRIQNLEWVTPAQNNAHAIAIGLSRHPATGPSPHRKLSPDQVQQIRHLHSQGLGARKLAQIFGISRSPMKRLLRGVTYQDV